MNIFNAKDAVFREFGTGWDSPESIRNVGRFLARIAPQNPLEAVLWERELWEAVMRFFVEAADHNGSDSYTGGEICKCLAALLSTVDHLGPVLGRIRADD